MRHPDRSVKQVFILPWIAPSPPPHHPRRPRRGPKRHIGGPHWTARQDWRQPSALTRAKPATRRLLVAGRDARQPVVGARLARAIGIPRRRSCCGEDFHGFARWRPYGYDIAAGENAQDGMPPTDLNVAHGL